MNKKELINRILDMSDDELSDISNYITKALVELKANGGTINLNGVDVEYLDVNIEDFYEENND